LVVWKSKRPRNPGGKRGFFVFLYLKKRMKIRSAIGLEKSQQATDTIIKAIIVRMVTG